MMILNFIKKVKKASAKHKILIVFAVLFLICIPVIVIGVNNTRDGYIIVKNDNAQNAYKERPAVFYNNNNNRDSISLNPIGACIRNASLTKDYFVPTGTLDEWTSFFNNHPADLTPVGCDGNGECKVGVENCSTAPNDCGACPGITITYVAGPGGTLTGSTTQVVVSGGNGTVVTANPGSGRKFIQWSDGNLNASRSETNVTVSKTLTASFTQSVAYMATPGGKIKAYSPSSRNEWTWDSQSGATNQYALDAGWEGNPAGYCNNYTYASNPWFTGTVYETGVSGVGCSQYWTPTAAAFQFFGWWGPCVEAVADPGYTFIGWEYGGSSMHGECSGGTFSPFILSGGSTYGYTNWSASNPVRRDIINGLGVSLAKFVPSGHCGISGCESWETCANSSNDYGPVKCLSDCGCCGGSYCW